MYLQDKLINKFEYFTMEELSNLFNTKNYLAPTTLSSSKDNSFMQYARSNPKSPIYQAIKAGSDFHKSIEDGIGVDKRNKELLDYFNTHIVPTISEVWAMEKAVVSHRHGLKGVLDGVGILKGRSTIWDYKKVNSLKSDKKLEGYFKQLASYAICHNEMYGEVNGRIDQIAVIQIAGKPTDQISHKITIVKPVDLIDIKKKYIEETNEWFKTRKFPNPYDV